MNRAVLLAVLLEGSADATAPEPDRPKVLIKADDLTYPLDPDWARFVDVAREYDIAVTIGIIGKSLDTVADPKNSTFLA